MTHMTKKWSEEGKGTEKWHRKDKYWKIESMHVGVKLLDQHGWTSDRDITQWLLSLTVNDSGKVSVGEVRQNDSVFRMNTSSRKVLREVLLGILITEPNMRRIRIRGRWCPRMKRVLRWSGFMFWGHALTPIPNWTYSVVTIFPFDARLPVHD